MSLEEPIFHSTPNGEPFPQATMSDGLSDGLSRMSISSLSKFESDSSDESRNSKDVSPSGSLKDFSLKTPVLHNSPMHSLEALSELDLSQGPSLPASSSLSMDIEY